MSLHGETSPFQGRVGIYYHGRQGTICADDWDIQNARVVCRQLGYGPALHAKVAEPYYSNGDPVHLNAVKCIGDELYLAACSHAKFGDNSCTHTIDAAVECSEPSVTGK